MSWDVVATWVRINRGDAIGSVRRLSVVRFVLPYPNGYICILEDEKRFVIELVVQTLFW